MNIIDKSESQNIKAYIFGGIFALSNKLQLLGDKFDSNISTKQWFLIAIISSFQDKAPTISMTSERVGNSRQNVKKMAEILEKKGFLAIVKDQEDGRIQRLKLTKHCQDYFKQRNQGEDQFMESLFENFDETLLIGLLKGMEKLESNVLNMEKKHE